MSLEHLAYVSSATGLLSEQALKSLLDSAARLNGAHGVTGMLLYSDGNFLQILEGSPAALDETMARIHRDRRHHDVMVLFREPIAERDFSAWKMGLRILSHSQLAEHPECIPFFSPNYDASKIVNPKSEALKFLLSFRSSN